MGESSKYPKSWNFEIPILKPAVCLLDIHNYKLNGKLYLNKLKKNQRSYTNLPNSAFWGCLSTESQPQNPEFRNSPENFLPCIQKYIMDKLVIFSQLSCAISLFSCAISLFSCAISLFSCAISLFSYAISLFSCAISLFSCAIVGPTKVISRRQNVTTSV